MPATSRVGCTPNGAGIGAAAAAAVGADVALARPARAGAAAAADAEVAGGVSGRVDVIVADEVAVEIATVGVCSGVTAGGADAASGPDGHGRPATCRPVGAGAAVPAAADGIIGEAVGSALADAACASGVATDEGDVATSIGPSVEPRGAIALAEAGGLVASDGAAVPSCGRRERASVVEANAAGAIDVIMIAWPDTAVAVRGDAGSGGTMTSAAVITSGGDARSSGGADAGASSSVSAHAAVPSSPAGAAAAPASPAGRGADGSGASGMLCAVAPEGGRLPGATTRLAEEPPPPCAALGVAGASVMPGDVTCSIARAGTTTDDGLFAAAAEGAGSAELCGCAVDSESEGCRGGE